MNKEDIALQILRLNINDYGKGGSRKGDEFETLRCESIKVLSDALKKDLK